MHNTKIRFYSYLYLYILLHSYLCLCLKYTVQFVSYIENVKTPKWDFPTIEIGCTCCIQGFSIDSLGFLLTLLSPGIPSPPLQLAAAWLHHPETVNAPSITISCSHYWWMRSVQLVQSKGSMWKHRPDCRSCLSCRLIAVRSRLNRPHLCCSSPEAAVLLAQPHNTQGRQHKDTRSIWKLPFISFWFLWF